MSFYLNRDASERIRKNGTFIETLACCGYIVNREDRKCHQCGKQVNVTLQGIRNQVSQTYQWHIFIGEPKGKPLASLTCANCTKTGIISKTINTENRQCKCGGYVSLELRQNIQNEGRWELHREVTMKPLPTPGGIIIATENAQPNRPINAQPLKLPPNFDPVIGGLYCPFGHSFSYTGMPHVDEDAKCTGHHVKLSAVLVFTDQSVMIERRAHDLTTGNLRGDMNPKWIQIAQLICPYCEHPITDKSLLCTAKCKSAYIIDVVQKPPKEMSRPVGVGTDIHIFIEIEPRWAWDTTRPENALVMEGSNWEDTETPSQPEPDIDPDQPKDHDTIYAAYIHLKTMGYSLRAAAAEIGISKGLLEHIIKKKRAENERQKMRDRDRKKYQ